MKKPQMIWRLFGALACSAMLAGCGGGGGSDSPSGGSITASSISLPSSVQVVTAN